jgi:hypothetical protein
VEQKPFFWMAPHPRFLEDSDKMPLCKLSGILVDSQKHFNAGQERKFEEIAYISSFNRLAGAAGSEYRSEIERTTRHCRINWREPRGQSKAI